MFYMNEEYVFFLIIFLIYLTLHHIFFTFYFIQLTSCVSISIIVWLNKKFILINKVGSKIYVTWSNIFIYKCFLIFSIYVS